MATALQFDGPSQRGRGVQGQYVYWICQAYPLPATVSAHGIKTPDDFDADSFRGVVIEAHAHCNITIIETCFFKEPHSNGKPHLNLLVKASGQYRWKRVAERLLQHDKVHVGFGTNIRTWMDGAIYGCVASEHKPEPGLDPNPVQWIKQGVPVPIKDFVPLRMQKPGFVRQPRLTPLNFFDICQEHGFENEDQLWAKAVEMSATGDRALLAFLMDNDVRAAFAKVQTAFAAKEKARRATLTREALLEEFFAASTCCCEAPAQCYDLMKEILKNNGIDGAFQREVIGVLRAGRAKMRNLCLVGPTNCAKSFLMKGLLQIYDTYERPDGGSYQLEDLLGKELVFLNDFEFDAGAAAWMPWQFLKNFLEGQQIKVGVPKTRGGNQKFKGTAPVFLTAPQKITLVRRNAIDSYETEQMNKRVKYIELHWQIPEEQVKEVTKVCGHCSARLYLEGKNAAPNIPAAALPSSVPSASAVAALPRVPPAGSSPPAPAAHAQGPPAKKARTANDVVQRLTELKALLDNGSISPWDFFSLKTRLLNGD